MAVYEANVESWALTLTLTLTLILTLTLTPAWPRGEHPQAGFPSPPGQHLIRVQLKVRVRVRVRGRVIYTL